MGEFTKEFYENVDSTAKVNDIKREYMKAHNDIHSLERLVASRSPRYGSRPPSVSREAGSSSSRLRDPQPGLLFGQRRVGSEDSADFKMLQAKLDRQQAQIDQLFREVKFQMDRCKTLEFRVRDLEWQRESMSRYRDRLPPSSTSYLDSRPTDWRITSDNYPETVRRATTHTDDPLLVHKRSTSAGDSTTRLLQQSRI